MPSCWWNSLSSLMREMSCWFSSQVPLSSFLDDIMKFVEVHQPFLKHNWLHDIKLWRLNCLTTWPRRRLFSLVVKYAVRDDGSSLAAKAAKSVIPSRTMKKKTFFISITNRSQWRLWSHSPNASCSLSSEVVEIAPWNTFMKYHTVIGWLKSRNKCFVCTTRQS